MNHPAEPPPPIADVLLRAGIRAQVRAVIACASGGNNRIYKVQTSCGDFAAKVYFRHEGDSRDRLAAEYAFLAYAMAAAPGLTPRPIACDTENATALYEFVEGRRFVAGEIGIGEVDAAIRFFRALNPEQSTAAIELPVASEACFSIRDHLGLIRTRIDRLLQVPARSDIEIEALELFRRLDIFWQRLSAQILDGARRCCIDIDTPLAKERRCISPSDFGFHNALVEPGGRIRFLDFEYAGWDDPAKAAGDFFAQLAVPVPAEFFDRFVTGILQGRPGAGELTDRAVLLRPAYKVKWCCIALNVFLPVHLARRRFSDPALDETAVQRAQLGKARQLLDSVEATTHGLH